jgi:hypothetical protein
VGESRVSVLMTEQKEWSFDTYVKISPELAKELKALKDKGEAEWCTFIETPKYGVRINE